MLSRIHRKSRSHQVQSTLIGSSDRSSPSEPTQNGSHEARIRIGTNRTFAWRRIVSTRKFISGISSGSARCRPQSNHLPNLERASPKCSTENRKMRRTTCGRNSICSSSWVRMRPLSKWSIRNENIEPIPGDRYGSVAKPESPSWETVLSKQGVRGR